MMKTPVNSGFKWRQYLSNEWMLYMLLIPGLLYFLIFKYIPMYGVTIAFRDYNVFKGFSDAPFVGIKNFITLFSREAFLRALGNNIIISFQKLIIGFPAPIILALMINELNRRNFKKFIQTSLILPNFVSWVVVNGLLYAIFSPSAGAIQSIAGVLGYEGTLPNILAQKETFRSVILWSHIWKNAGMGTIVYLAALSGIDQQLYEAAMVDGAGKWKQLMHITLPSIRTTIVVLLIFRVGEVMYAGFDQIFAISNPMVISVADIIDTYVYKIGLQDKQFSLATAAGLFQSAVGMMLVLLTNFISKKIDPESGLL